MTQNEIDAAVAKATGESIAEIHHRGFAIADEVDVEFDPEPRAPLILDWDTMTVADSP